MCNVKVNNSNEHCLRQVTGKVSIMMFQHNEKQYLILLLVWVELKPNCSRVTLIRMGEKSNISLEKTGCKMLIIQACGGGLWIFIANQHFFIITFNHIEIESKNFT